MVTDSLADECDQFGKDRPLVIALDTSGSMADDDGNGTIKLAGAQAALSQAIRQQRPGAALGLWSYPGGDLDAEGCGVGGFDIPVSTLDQRSMIGSIRALTADGETPTGPALRSLVDDLKTQGYTGATLLLVSDGLANCGEDPCEVTKEILAEGFDVTVQAAGFQISAEGLEQLQCIASASGGSVLQADSVADLEQAIQQFGRAELTIDVKGLPVRTPAGSATLVTATVTNASAVDVLNARVQLDFGGRSSDLIPAVLPPIVSLGNVRAGSSRSHTWTVSYGSRDKSGTAQWSMSAWGKNANPTRVAGTVRVFPGPLRLEDGGGIIGEIEGGRIAILGDSYSAGEGAGDYDPDTDVPGNRCHRSGLTYMAPFFAAGDLELLACSGATTRYYRGSNSNANGVQEDQVGRLVEGQEDRGAVTAGFMTVGGNDIGFGAIVSECLIGHPTNATKLAAALGARARLPFPVTAAMIAATWDTRCADDESLTTSVYDAVDQLGPDLSDTYRQAYDAMNQPRFVAERGGAIAPLYVLAYPQPFPERQWASFCPGFDVEEVAFANELVDRLNAEIESTVREMRRNRYRIGFVSPVQGAFLPDHTACARPGAQPFLNPVDLASGAVRTAEDKITGRALTQEFMHPNRDGYAVETDVVIAWSATTPEPDSPPGGGAWRQSTDSSWSLMPTVVATLTLPVPRGVPLVVDAGERAIVSEPLDVRGGQSIPVQIQGAAPGAHVWVSIQSRRKVIGSFFVDQDGAAEGVVTVPPSTAAGGHRLTVLTTDSSGNPLVVTQVVDVSRRIPFWLAPLAVLTLFLGVLSVVLDRRWRRTSSTSRERSSRH